MRIVCSEPSPDAFSVISNSLSESAEYQQLALSIAIQNSEKGAGLGIRTTSVQALRDAMYRVCESYAGGGINPYMYGILLQRYQNILVGLIAIEQLTTAVAKSDIKISSQPDDKRDRAKKGGVGEQKSPQENKNTTSLGTELKPIEDPSGRTSGKNKIDANTVKSKNETPATQEAGNEEQSGTDTAAYQEPALGQMKRWLILSETSLTG